MTMVEGRTKYVIARLLRRRKGLLPCGGEGLLKAILASFMVLCNLSYAGDHWPQFLGPDGNGRSDAVDLPLNWSETKNVAWKTLIHDRGWSSPVMLGRQIWLTTATKDGHQLYALCLDRETGKVLKDLELFEV